MLVAATTDRHLAPPAAPPAAPAGAATTGQRSPIEGGNPTHGVPSDHAARCVSHYHLNAGFRGVDEELGDFVREHPFHVPNKRLVELRKLGYVPDLAE